ncbi:sedoheptulokinase [Paenibacillus cremeus]|uniref:Carbohydrate kinase FGGY N-terminal domain-containing protein n=1 Tax=Paenibacillus cremeus TaxID=2163881 RepID=A0A559K8D4_9BACL|nr:FGGY family carbohydrate kinase [Paenibacillus cremeus]TVY08395.1 hypothetical protein FPZ49_19345 [Paenibacillus cremeus]
MKFLGIDIGSSYLKAALFDLSECRIQSIRKIKAPEFVPHASSNFKENDPIDFLNRVVEMIDQYLDEDLDIQGIVFSTQMHGFVLTDESGEPISNFIGWQDRRALERVEDSNETYLEWLERLMDSRVHNVNGVCSLYHWVLHHPKEKAWFCTLGDFIISKLSGEKPACHLTNAASTGMVNLEQGEWDWKLIRTLGLDHIVFPPIVKESAATGIYRTRNQQISLYPAVGDQQAALLGSFIRPDQDLVLNIGTGAQMCILDQHPTFGSYETRPFFEGMYFRTLSHIPGGRSLQVLVDFIKGVGEKIYGQAEIEDGEIWGRVDRYLAFIQETDLQVNVSFFNSSMQPDEGSVRNIKEHNFKVEDLFLGALNNMADQYLKHYRILKSPQENQVNRVICAGGVVRKSPILFNLIGERFSMPCELSPFSEDTLVGLFRIALVCAQTHETLESTFDVMEKLQM